MQALRLGQSSSLEDTLKYLIYTVADLLGQPEVTTERLGALVDRVFGKSRSPKPKDLLREYLIRFSRNQNVLERTAHL